MSFRHGLDERKPSLRPGNWAVGTWRGLVRCKPVVPQKPKGLGRPVTRHRDDRCPPLAVSRLASEVGLPQSELARGKQRLAVFALAANDRIRHAPIAIRTGRRPAQTRWLLRQWFDGDSEPTKFWFSSLPERTIFALAHSREDRQETGAAHSTITANSSRRSARPLRGPYLAKAFTITPRFRSVARAFRAPKSAFSPRSRRRWTSLMVRRHLQQLLLRWIADASARSCRQILDPSALPRRPCKI